MKELNVTEMQEVNGGGSKPGVISGGNLIAPFGGIGGGVRDDIASPILFDGLAGGVELCGGSTISIIVTS